MSQVLTSSLSFQRAMRTSSTLQSTRTATWSSASDMTCAWTPPMSPTTRTRSFFGARSVRCWRSSLNECTWALVSSAAAGATGLGISPLVEEGAAAGDELVASWPGADKLHRRADQLANPIDVITTRLRKIVPAPRCANLVLPPRHFFVDRLAVLVMRDVRQGVVESLAPEVVAGADLQ